MSRDFLEPAQNVLLFKVNGVVDSAERMNVSPLLRTTQAAIATCRNLNCWTAAITKKHRETYIYRYPTYLILPNGSSIHIEYDVPRAIVKLPLNLESLPEEERRLRVAARTPISKIKIEEEVDDDFDATKFYKTKK